MKILVGHSNMDLDCMGSLVLGRYLYPDAVCVKSRLIHPVAKSLYNLYKKHLNFMSSKDLRDQHVDEIVILDTRTSGRIREYMEFLPDFDGRMIVYDHHCNDSCDLKNAEIHSESYGSNTTILALILKESGTELNPVDATIALTGIFADTGNFTHENVCVEDFRASTWLMKQGASMKLVSQFLKPLKQDYQISLFHQVLNRLVYKKIHGHTIILSYFEMKDQVSGLAPIVEKVFEVENADALFVLFGLEKANKTLIIGRSQKETIDVSSILAPWGGGGHTRAASAQLKGKFGQEVYESFIKGLTHSLLPAVSAEDLMTPDVDIIQDSWSVLDASIFLEKIGHTGAPVLNDDNELIGFMTLRDISKARKSEQMKAPVRSYMTRKVHSCKSDASVKELESFFLQFNVGHIPVTHEGRLLGIVTRTDYLNYLERR
ncbi:MULTISPECIES: CBS domain-containing protein [unclassified Oceanispirochaeta]|uniref:CBS domain-containing protein n=1 Tax=unclassified Oceanispirochaeta TaxID=2635722 RepID=UPI000E094AC2|nr:MULTISPECIES: CBS domain-containing protein [unclassified Oceanispirochaeta]MBF9015380.1 CBS domain-containing protein [Oceanispirochaeta sp. M2]NPD71839.1 CBS domain-containing protein [Oceanispirochaeta sp. M1]RDG32650.1 CBS domain-containing protein [Oceanispirochaeta sp. M1]